VIFAHGGFVVNEIQSQYKKEFKEFQNAICREKPWMVATQPAK
jgi:hypothetical protein